MTRFLLIIIIFILLVSFKRIFKAIISDLKKMKPHSESKKEFNDSFELDDVQDADFEDIE